MEKVRKVLFWCMLMGFGVMFIWFGMILLGGKAIYSFHSRFWGMDQLFTKEFFYTANLIGMWKMAVILFFAIPWLAMKIIGK